MNVSALIQKMSVDIEKVAQSIPSLTKYKDFYVRDIRGKKYVVAQATKITETLQFMKSENLKGLEINMSLGYPNLEIRFLKDFHFLEDLIVIYQPLQKTSELNNLHNLKTLSLDSYFYSELDFDNFPNLTEVSIHWTKNAKNLFKQKQLQSLKIRYYNGTDLLEISNLVNLTSLSIVKSPLQSIKDLKKLEKLTELQLALLANLDSLNGIEDLKNLQKLDVQGCRKIKSINELGNLSNLEYLSLNNCGDIDSLTPIEKLINLESFFFIESTSIKDGNLDILLKIKKLKQTSFQNRKHYNHKREDIYRYLEEKN